MKTSPVKVIADAILEKKGQRPISLDLREIGTAITDHFVICNADSTTQVAAIAENILDRMEEKLGRKVLRMQSLENDIWVILDYGDVVVHVFQTEYREFYRLEDLWADAPCVEYRDEPQQEETPSAKKTKAGSKVRATAKKVRKVEE